MPARDKYTDPELREQVKEEIHASDKGGRPGQWSARKAQMMASEYKKRGGGYTTDKETGQDESQKHLQNWTEEEWQTKEGKGNATKEDGTKKRYLPKNAWKNMSESEKEETEAKKEQGEKQGKQYVGNTEKASEERKKASESDKVGHGTGSKGSNGQNKKTRGQPRKESKKGGSDEEEAEEQGLGNSDVEIEGDVEDGDEEYLDKEEGKEDEDGESEKDQVEADGDEQKKAASNTNGDADGEPHGTKRVHTRQDDGVSKKQKVND